MLNFASFHSIYTTKVEKIVMTPPHNDVFILKIDHQPLVRWCLKDVRRLSFSWLSSKTQKERNGGNSNGG